MKIFDEIVTQNVKLNTIERTIEKLEDVRMKQTHACNDTHVTIESKLHQYSPDIFDYCIQYPNRIFSRIYLNSLPFTIELNGDYAFTEIEFRRSSLNDTKGIIECYDKFMNIVDFLKEYEINTFQIEELPRVNILYEHDTGKTYLYGKGMTLVKRGSLLDILIYVSKDLPLK